MIMRSKLAEHTELLFPNLKKYPSSTMLEVIIVESLNLLVRRLLSWKQNGYKSQDESHLS